MLGPTEDRVARYLDSMTRSGRVTIRTVDLASRLGLERSEAYRITRRLRVLGLFGIENDRSGANGGRRYWRTATEHDGVELDVQRHRDAWARITGWAAASRGRALARLDHLRRQVRGVRTARESATDPGRVPPAAGGPSFRDMFGATPDGARLLKQWGVT